MKKSFIEWVKNPQAELKEKQRLDLIKQEEFKRKEQRIREEEEKRRRDNDDTLLLSIIPILF